MKKPKEPPAPRAWLEHLKVNAQMIGPEVEVVQVIKTNLERRGAGVEGDPVRRITQFWDMEGTLLFEFDPVRPAKKD